MLKDNSTPNLKAALIQKAMEDPVFKAELLADPKGAIERLVGLKLPEALEVEVVQETLGTAVLVLPFQPASGELSDQDLESVAGGSFLDAFVWVVYTVGTLGVGCVVAATKEYC